MRVLLVSVKAGYGHHSTAKAIIDLFHQDGIESEMLDLFEYISPSLGDSIQDGYLFSTKYFSKIYGKVYSKIDKNDEPYSDKSLVSMASKLVSSKIDTFLKQYQPDMLICTHSYAAYIATILKHKGMLSCPVIGIITDFTVHPFWESCDIDYYVTADALLNHQMLKKGIPIEKILPIGIPIGEQFSHKISKEEARKQLDIPDIPTILVMMGSMGYGNIKETIQELDEHTKEFQILCVCGNNKKIQDALNEEQWYKNVMVYGFVNNIDVMMDASDIIISKPGGLTTSETLAKGLPMISMNPLPGQEDRNLAFLVNSNAAIMVTSEFPVSEALDMLMECPWRVALMKESIAHIGKPNASYDLVAKVKELLSYAPEIPSEKETE